MPWPRVNFSAGPLGRPAAVLLAVLILCGGWVALRPAPPRADLRLWTFAATHAAALREGGPSPLDVFERRTGRSASVELMDQRALSLRLTSLLRGGSHGDGPDVVMLELLSAASVLDRPPSQIGLLPLDPWLDSSGLRGRLLAGKLRTWQRGGRAFGVPLDVHPVALAYRRDLFDAAGVDVAACATWPQLADALRRYVEHRRSEGHGHAVGLELARSKSDHLTLMLQQRGVELFDEGGGPTLNTPLVVDTLAFHAGLTADGLAGPISDGHGRWARDLARGDVAMLWMPDWRLMYLELSAPELAGKVALMPLPRFDPDDATTAVWGGAMLAIPANARDPEAAWKLLEFVAESDVALAGRRRETHILPPLPGVWLTPAYQVESDYFSGQPVQALYADLAVQARPMPTTPLHLAAYAHLAAIAARSADFRDGGGGDAELRELLPRWLVDAEADLRRRAAFRSPSGV